MTKYALTSVADIRAANSDAGQHFFDAASCRFFRSRIGRRVWRQPDGSALFVTSEQDFGRPRRWTVRICWPDSGHIDAISDFQQFKGPQSAARWAQRHTAEAHYRYQAALAGREFVSR